MVHAFSYGFSATITSRGGLPFWNRNPASMGGIMNHRKINLSALFVVALMALCFYAVFVFPIYVSCRKLMRPDNSLSLEKR